MPWIKRNLFFLIGGVVAVVLLGLAGFYCFSKWQLNNRNLADLDKAYEELKRINALNPIRAMKTLTTSPLPGISRPSFSKPMRRSANSFCPSLPSPIPPPSAVKTLRRRSAGRWMN
jgi:hypothetical protein